MSTKIILILHIFGQAITQTAILALFPDSIKPYFQAVAILIGLIIATLDPTATLNKLGMTHQEFLGRIDKK